jgi:hypothetical protein
MAGTQGLFGSRHGPSGVNRLELEHAHAKAVWKAAERITAAVDTEPARPGRGDVRYRLSSTGRSPT